MLFFHSGHCLEYHHGGPICRRLDSAVQGEEGRDTGLLAAVRR